MNQPSEPSASIEFGRFRVLRPRRELLVDGIPHELGGRAFDILIALIDAGGSVLSKDELINRVWAGRIVEENNLQVQIAALRKAFGADRDLIRTVAGRGYQFTGERRAATVSPAAAASPPPTNLMTSVSELIGRDVEFGEIIDLVKAHRLVTLTGAGGIGKTRLGLEAGRQLLPAFAGGVWVAELGPLSDPALVPVAVASALGLTIAAGASPERVATALGTKQVLLILDNCEHVIDAAARMAEALLRASPLARVIATSREPLRTAGEYVYRVPSLAVPAESVEEPEDLMQIGAVKLFIARARAAEPHFSPDRRTAAIIGAICRRLDGIALAIELAAARTAALGVEGLAARLDDRFRLLTGGHRTALPRHQTLRATLDWSYELLAEPERVVLRRLGMFAGAFGLESASAVATSAQIAPSDVVDGVVNLVAKSLLSAGGSAVAQYRLLETTRAYAIEKLREAGELELFARRHAEHYRDVFEVAAAEWETQPTADWLSTYGRHLDNVRVALDWAWSAGAGDPRIGTALTVAAVPLWMHLSLMEECRGRVEAALASDARETDEGTRQSMQLHAALGLALMYTRGAVPETRAALASALETAQRFGDADYQLRALWGLCVDRLNNATFREALALAEQFCMLAKDSPERPIGDRMMGLSLHFLGQPVDSRRHFESMLGSYVAPAHRAHIIRFQFDQRVTAHIALAEVLWILGYPDQAMRAVESNIEQAAGLHHALSLCNSLAKALPVAFLAGDLAAAERFVAMLLDSATQNALGSWQTEGRCYQSVLLIKRGDLARGVPALASALAELPGINFSLRYTALLGEYADALGRSGALGQGMIAIDQALERSERIEERWCIADLLRIKGELVALGGTRTAAAAAEQHFQQGLEWAQRQAALSWELRGATGLARLWHAQGKTDHARALLAPVYGRFSEGFETTDLKAAKALLETLQ